MNYTKDYYSTLKDSLLRNGFEGNPAPYLNRVEVETTNKKAGSYALKVYPFEGALPSEKVMFLVDFARAHKCEINLFSNWDNEPYFQIQKFV